MKVLILGATGFIGCHVASYLAAKGISVIIGAKSIACGNKRFPGYPVFINNFLINDDIKYWETNLKDINVVVNCVGLLHASDTIMEKVHVDTPYSIAQACKKQNILFIHLSAIGADPDAHTAYACSKHALEKKLSALDGKWSILRPSLVYSYGSYGGTSLFRGLSSLPSVIPVIGHGQQKFSPVHMDDLCQCIYLIITKQKGLQQTINIVGPEDLSFSVILEIFRKWLGLGTARILKVPMILIKIFTPVLSRLCPGVPINCTSLMQLNYGNTADPTLMKQTFGFNPKSMQQALQLYPSHVQDRWHARLYLLQPIIRLCLALFWILSGAIPLLTSAQASTLIILNQVDFLVPYSHLCLYISCFFDIVLGLGIMSSIYGRFFGVVQCLAIASYTIFLSLFLPEYWLDPFATLLKNIPIFLLTLVWLVIEEQR